MEKENYDYVNNFAQEMLSLTIGLTYSCMQPIILPFTFLFFFAAHFNAKYHFMFVIRTEFEGYNMLPTMQVFLSLSVVIFQATMAGVFLTQLFPTGTVFSFVMIVVTGIVYYLLSEHYEKSITFVPLRHCDPEKLKSVDAIEKISQMYVDPSQKKQESIYESIKHLRPDEAEAEIEEIMQESVVEKTSLGVALQTITAVGKFVRRAVAQGKQLDNLTKGSLERSAYKKSPSSNRSPSVLRAFSPTTSKLHRGSRTTDTSSNKNEHTDTGNEEDEDEQILTESDTDTETDEEDYRKRD